MAKKYAHPLSKELNPDNWKDKINLKELTLEELIDLEGDMKQMEKLGKALGGFLKEAIRARMPEDETAWQGTVYWVEFSEGYRQGGLDKDKLLEDYGEEWLAGYTKEGTEFTTMRVRRIDEEGE